MKPEEIRSRLTELDGLSEKTESAERRILTAAQSRIDAVQARIETLRPTVLLGAKAEEEYKALVEERRKLRVVIAQAQQVLRG